MTTTHAVICRLILPALFAGVGSMISVKAQNRCVISYQTQYRATVTIQQGSAYMPESVDEQPKFPGGESAMIHFINSERRYPRVAYDNSIEGRVLCSFVVEPDGRLTNIEVVRSVDENLDREALRVIQNMPRWEPGLVNGEKVAVYCLLTIPFRR